MTLSMEIWRGGVAQPAPSSGSNNVLRCHAASAYMPHAQIHRSKASQKSSHDSCSVALVAYQPETVCPEHLRQTIQKLLDDNENTNVKKDRHNLDRPDSSK